MTTTTTSQKQDRDVGERTPVLPVDAATFEDTEAPIREARERQRRRRLRLVAVVLVLVGAAGAAFGIIRGGSGSGPAVARVPNGPVVNLAAFAGHGRLAFVSHNQLWILNGSNSSLRKLSLPAGYFVPQQPLFSHDGRWLAYLLTSPNGVTPSQLWIARSDGTDPHVVPGIRPSSLFGWSPSSDVLAVSAGPQRTRQPCPCFSPTTLRLVSPDGSSRRLMSTGWVRGAVWSPSGTALAVGAVNGRRSLIEVYRVSGGSPTVWLDVGRHARLNGMNDLLFNPAGWWTRWGIGFWVFGDGAVRNNDASPLDVISAPGATPRLLGQTLSDGTTDVTAASTNGRLAIVTDHGGGRSAWQGKQADVCKQSTQTCAPLVRSPTQVTVDPVWSPDGRTLAFLEAPNDPGGPWTQQRIAAWYAAHHAWLYDAATGRMRRLAAMDGATAVSWSADGNSLVYVRGDAVWLLPGVTRRPVRIAGPLFPSGNWPQYYAQIPWSTQFAWWS